MTHMPAFYGGGSFNTRAFDPNETRHRYQWRIYEWSKTFTNSSSLDVMMWSHVFFFDSILKQRSLLGIGVIENGHISVSWWTGPALKRNLSSFCCYSYVYLNCSVQRTYSAHWGVCPLFAQNAKDIKYISTGKNFCCCEYETNKTYIPVKDESQTRLPFAVFRLDFNHTPNS